MKLRSRSMFNIFTLMALLASLLGSAVFVPSVQAAGFVVTKAADTNDGVCDNDCSLREAITAANTNGSGLDIIFFNKDYTITLAGSQLPAISTAITIAGNGMTNTIIQASATSDTATHRVFEVVNGGGYGNLTLDSLTVRNGSCKGLCDISANSNSNGGGGIFNNNAILSVTNSILSGNNANYGGGIYSRLGLLNVANSTFSENSVTDDGGGMYMYGTITMVDNATFFSNSAGNYGGGIYNYIYKLNVTNSTFSTNTADNGGGIFNDGILNVTNSTFFSNTAIEDGGGIDNPGIMTITNSTLSENSAKYGSGGGIFSRSNTNTLDYSNTIIANSTSGGDCSGMKIGVNINNLVEDGGCSVNGSNFIVGDPTIGPLADNGGPTQTFALLSGSSASDAGDATVCAAAVDNPNNGAGGLDQRGITRPQGSGCDIGAFEAITRFSDVSLNYWSHSYIERLAVAVITGGCGVGIYCPDATVTRAQMAVFLLKGMHGSSYTPPAVGLTTGFGDVATDDYWAAAWIKQLAAEGITSGCGGGNYCPESAVTRAQMAIFLLKAKHGSSYSPPNASGVFIDVPVGYWADKWIEQLSVEGVTSGCGNNNYCPDDSVTRAQMAVFLVKAFNLP